MLDSREQDLTTFRTYAPWPIILGCPEHIWPPRHRETLVNLHVLELLQI